MARDRHEVLRPKPVGVMMRVWLASDKECIASNSPRKSIMVPVGTQAGEGPGYLCVQQDLS